MSTRVITSRPPAQRLRFAGVALAIQAIDFALLWVGFLAITVLFGKPDSAWLAATVISPAVVALLWILGGYSREALNDPWRQVGLICMALLVTATGIVIAENGGLIVMDLAAPWRPALPALAIIALLPTRLAAASLLSKWRSQGRFAEVTAVICEGNEAIEAGMALARQVRGDPEKTLLGIYDVRDGTRSRLIDGLQLRGGPASLRADSRRRVVDRIVLAVSPGRASGYGLLDMFAGMDCEISCGIGPGAMVLQRRPLTDAQFVIKEAFNRIVASLLLLLCLPTLLLVALCIRLDSPGPVVFRQERTGYNDRRFLIFKFRTMHAHMADPFADQQTTRADPRITRVGKVLRKLSIDELPQLLNVIIGDMALVGPRPHAPNTKAGGIIFDDVLEEYAQRHRVKPGITGWAQVNGWRGETQVPEQVRRRVEHDLYYIDHWSVWLDIRIIVLTVFREIFSKHAF